MKSFFLLGILFLSTSIIFAQETIRPTTNKEIKDSTSVKPKIIIGLGANIIDNGGENFLPFNAKTFSFKTPFYISAERRFKSNYSIALVVSTNEVAINSIDKSYGSVDAIGQYYFDDYIFNTPKVELYAGLGLGLYFLENKGNGSFDVTGGVKYWFLDHYGLSLQGFGKVSLGDKNEPLNNHFQYNIGLVWRN